MVKDMETITVNGKLYDPYFILGVTRDDSNDHITKAFRRKVKKYHPDKYTDLKDKKKYECYFKILVASFEYIKEKRQNKRSIHLIDRKKNGHEVKEIKTCNKDEFNKEFENKMKDPNDYGYGDDYKRMECLDDYEKLEINLVNLFNNKKFSNKQFNKIFEWNKYQNSKMDKEKESKQLIHKTTDGFYAYNSGTIDGSALVSSYNGLLIVGDDLGEKGVGYWGDNYSDYRIVHKGTLNPVKKPKIPKNFNSFEEINKTTKNIKEEELNIKKTSFNDEKDVLYKRQYEDLLEKEKLDKEMVMKYIHKYKNSIKEAALKGELDQSQSYTDVLRKYIRN